jgi:hypothetical protein
MEQPRRDGRDIYGRYNKPLKQNRILKQMKTKKSPPSIPNIRRASFTGHYNMRYVGASDTNGQQFDYSHLFAEAILLWTHHN